MDTGSFHAADLVFVQRNPDHEPGALRRHLDALLEGAEARRHLPPAGARVLVKPFLDADQPPFAGWSTHPWLLRAVVEWLQRRGLRVQIGDVRRCLPHTPAAGLDWLLRLAEETGAETVDFAAAGVRRLPARSWLHHDYPLSRAALDADAVIDLASAAPHRRFVLSGAVKNLFNVAIGDGQARLEQHYLWPQRDVARVIADVCAHVRPVLTVLDLTAMPMFGEARPRPVGVLLAGTGPATVDALAARILGWEEVTVHTTQQAARLGLGTDDPRRMQVIGPPLPRVHVPLPQPLPYPGTAQRLLQLLQRRLDRPQLLVDPATCCGRHDCRCVCGEGAIRRLADGRAWIDAGRCIDCGLCAALCRQGAIGRQPVGIGRWLRARLQRTPSVRPCP